MQDFIHNWGSSAAERALPFSCDGYLRRIDQVLFRALTVYCPAAHLYRWMGQLRLAPYSYDWIDNLGRQSPQRLVPGLPELAVGQVAMMVFRVVEFSPNQHLTLKLRSSLLVDLAVTYRLLPVAGGCRLVVKLSLSYARGPLGWLARLFLPAGDLVMMRKQLLTLKRLAESSSAA